MYTVRSCRCRKARVLERVQARQCCVIRCQSLRCQCLDTTVADIQKPPKFSVLINDTEPIFFYCSAPGACEEDIMIGVINPNSTHTLEVQQAFAHNSTVAFSPGENFPEEVASTKSAAPSSTSTTASATTATVTASPTTPVAAASSGSHPPLSTGAIAGIAIGGAAVLLLGGALVYLCGRQRTLGELLRHSQQPPPSYVPSAGHMSMASSAAYTKSPHVEVDSQRFSGPAGYFNGENESYRSRSPPTEDAMEYSNIGGNASPNRASSPIIRRPIPQSPGRSELTPVTLTDRPMSETPGSGNG